MKKIKLDQDKLLGIKILQPTPELAEKQTGEITATTIKGKIGEKTGVKPKSRRTGKKLGGKIGGKIGDKGT